MAGIAYRLILLTGGFGLFMLGLLYFGLVLKPTFPSYFSEPPPLNTMLGLLGCVFAMLIGLIFIWGALLGSLGGAVDVWFTRPISAAIGAARTNTKRSERRCMDEFEAEKKGGQKCPNCGSYDTYYVETVGVDTAQFKCNRCGSYFLKD